MDPVRNPLHPRRRRATDELAGHDEEIKNFKVLLARLLVRRPEQSQIVTGLRSVGKAVLLNTFEDYAESAEETA
jgi:hypothetical protein